ncbi:MAG: 3-hydroxyisobutyrate dehydrogenase [Atopobiaceae bacterium]|jgi:hypothetical protein
MDQELLDFTTKKVEAMLRAPMASKDTKAAAQAWKDAISDGEDAETATNALMDAISEKQTTIDGVIAFAQSDMCKQIYGEKKAANMLAHERARKEAGAKFCDCLACKPCHELLAKFGREEPDVYL